MDQRQRVCEVRAPAKLILCGQHAVVYGEDAVAMGIGLYCSALVCKRQQKSDFSKLTFQLEIEEDPIEIELELIAEFQRFWQEHEENCSYELFLQKICSKYTIRGGSFNSLHYKIGLFSIKKGIDWKIWSKQSKQDWIVTIQSKIPLGKGLGSSAAFNTVLSTVLLFMFGKLHLNQTKQLNFQTKEQINRLAYLFECVQHGTPSGIDNFVSVYGGLIVFNRTKEPKFKLLKGAAEKLRKMVDLAIADSKVQKNTKVAVERVRQLCKRNEEYVEKIKQMGRISLHIIEMLSSQGQFQKNQLFQLITNNHKLLSQFGLSHPEIQKLIQLGKNNGWAGKITGSGMGGCILLVAACNQATMQKQFILSPFDQQGLTISLFQPKY